jgi:hypothetical protein
MIKNNKDITGIRIYNKEHKLSQYADDTQLFLDGTEKSLRSCLQTLENFHKISGLKINKEKTKAYWIGSTRNSVNTLCDDYPLDWSQVPLKILGVNFSAQLSDIWVLNGPDILTKCEKLIKTWSKRNLTLIGKITVIKSLVLSKFVHLFIALPNPPTEIIKQLEQMSFKFIWSNGPDRIKRNLLMKDTEQGGLGMYDIKNFINALKISWLRRLLLNNCDSWESLSLLNLKHLLNLGSNFAIEISNTLSNPFWKNVIYSWHLMCNNVEINDLNKMLFSPLWKNNKMANGSLYFDCWYKKNVINVIDLYGEDGHLLTFEQLKERYRIHGTFIDYYRVLNNIPLEWRQQIANNTENTTNVKINMHTNPYTAILLKTNKGSRSFYEHLRVLKETDKLDKWNHLIVNLNENNCKQIFANLKTIKETKLQNFQFKINNKILVTKSFLFKINKATDELCSYCKQSRETIEHLFLDCPITNLFITRVQTWLEDECSVVFSLQNRHFIFSFQEKNCIGNFISVLVKHYIYRSKFRENCDTYLSVQFFKIYLKQKLESKHYIAKLQGKQDTFSQNFGTIYRKVKES